MPFLIDFCSILPPNLASKTPQNRSKIDAQIASLFACVFWSIFGRFLLPTWTLRTHFGTSGLVFSWFFRFSANIDFWSHFGANLAPFCFPKSTKNAPKTDPKSRRSRFRAYFGKFLGPKIDILAPKMVQKSTKNRSKNDVCIRLRFFINFLFKNSCYIKASN